MSFLLWFLFTTAHAQEKSAFEQTMALDTAVLSDESWVEIKSVRYRKYEFKSGIYYVKFDPKNTLTAELFCTPPAGFKEERLVVDVPSHQRRSRGFVQAFNEGCKNKPATGKALLHLDPKEGLSYPEKAKD